MTGYYRDSSWIGDKQKDVSLAGFNAVETMLRRQGELRGQGQWRALPHGAGRARAQPGRQAEALEASLDTALDTALNAILHAALQAPDAPGQPGYQGQHDKYSGELV